MPVSGDIDQIKFRVEFVARAVYRIFLLHASFFVRGT